LTGQFPLNHTYDAQQFPEEPPSPPSVDPVMPDGLELRVGDVTYHRRDKLFHAHRHVVLVPVVVQVPEGHPLPIVSIYPPLSDRGMSNVPADVLDHALVVVYRVLRPSRRSPPGTPGRGGG
jgi:hypothetical protein